MLLSLSALVNLAELYPLSRPFGPNYLREWSAGAAQDERASQEPVKILFCAF